MKKAYKYLICLSIFAFGSVALLTSIKPISNNSNDVLTINNHLTRSGNYIPTAINKNNVVSDTFNANGYNAIINWTNIDTIESSLKRAIVGTDWWASALWVGLPFGLLDSDVEINGLNTDNAANGSISLSEIKLKSWFDTNGLQSSLSSNFIPNGLTINGLNRAPTVIKSTLTINNDIVEWDATNTFSYTDTKPSDFIKQFDNTKLTLDILRNNLLDYLPTEFDSTTDYEITNPIANDINGTVDFQLKLKDFNNANGELEPALRLLPYTIRLTNLKKVYNWKSNLLVGSNYEYSLGNNDPIQMEITSLNETYLADYIKNHINIFLHQDLNHDDDVTIGALSYDLNNKTVTLQNVTVGTSTLPNLTIKNFIFLPFRAVSKKASVTIDKFAALYVFELQKKVANDAINDLSASEFKTQLSNLYDGLTNIDVATTYTLALTNINTYNESGLIQFTLVAIDNTTGLKYIVGNDSFTSTKLGISSLKTEFYVDDSASLSAIATQLKDPSQFNTYITNHAAELINTYGDFSDVTFTNNSEVTYNIGDNYITTSVYMKPAVDATNYYPNVTSVNPILLGKLRISNNHAPTTISKNFDYAKNQEFTNIKTPSDFKKWVDTNKNNQTFLKSLVTINNPIDDTYTISIVGDPAISDCDITYTFSINQGYDANGSFTSNITKNITYKLLYANGLETSVNSVINLPSPDKYAFEYTDTDLASISNLVTNALQDTNITVSITETNNRDRCIIADVTVDKYQDRNGIHNTESKTFRNIKFTGAKEIKDATRVLRNTTVVSQTISEFKALLTQSADEQLKVLGPYVDIINESASTSYPTKLAVKSFKEVKNNLNDTARGLFAAEFVLTNYFKGDDLLSFDKNTQTTGNTITFAIIPSNPTEVNGTVVANGIVATDPLDKLILNELVGKNDINNPNDAKLKIIKQWIVNHFTDIFTNYAHTPSIDVIGIKEITKDTDTSVNVTVILKNATNSVGDEGDFDFTFKITNFTSPVTQIVGKTLTVDQAASAGITGLSANDYSIDFSNTYGSTFDNLFKTNVDATITKWFDNATGLKIDASNKPFINPEKQPTYIYNHNQLTIAGSFLGWNASLNPNDEYQYVDTTITITGFNATNTTANTTINLQNNGTDAWIYNLKPSAVTPDDLKTHLNSDWKNRVFVNYPQAMVVSKIQNISAYDTTGLLKFDVDVENAKIDATSSNNGFGKKSFSITINNLKQPQNPTTGKSLTISQANANGLNSINALTYSFDFEDLAKQQLLTLLTDPNNMDLWFDNAPGVDKINGQTIIKQNSSITIKSSVVDNENIVSITGDFIGWNTSGDQRDPLEYSTKNIIIRGFNKRDTTTSAIALPNDIINPLEYSATDAVAVLNGALKDKVKTWLSTNLAGYVLNKPNDFDIVLSQKINSGDFKFVVNGDKIELEVTNVPQVINNGSEMTVDRRLVFSISNTFNSTNVNTTTVAKTIRYGSSEFDSAFKNISIFAYDWQQTQYYNTNNISDALKNYITDNKSSFIITSNQNQNLLNNVVINTVTIDVAKMTQSSNGGDWTCEATFTYKGYVNGTIQDNLTSDKITIILKQYNSEDIQNEIRNFIGNQYKNYDLSSQDAYDDFIKKYGQNIINSIVGLINNSNNLPESLKTISNQSSLTPDKIFKWDGKNGIQLIKNAIQITGTYDKQTVVNIPDENLTVINGRKITVSKTTPNWVLILVFGVFTFSIIILSICYEIGMGSKRRKTQRTLDKEY